VAVVLLVAVLGIVELLALDVAALWLWSGVVVVAPVVLVADEFCAEVVVLADVSFVTGGVEPEVEA
jgi:hypothetical protein